MGEASYRYAFSTAAVALSALAVAFVITGAMRRLALRRGVLDIPNDRSSHRSPTPRGGGISIVVAVSGALPVLYWLGALPRGMLLAIGAGGITVAAVGLVDDRRRLSAGLRITVHFAAAVWALACLGGVPALRLGDHIVAFGWAGYLLGALGIVWTLNLFNFMDGIDGIAASEATFVSWAGGLLAGEHALVAAASTLGCACLGFLRWNWPPARIFMGDVGSGYLGYVIGVLALAAARVDPAALWVWLILGGVFFIDATVTLARRVSRGERVDQAHRTHAYQWLARRWGSHLRVTLAVLIINVLWLLPCAAFADLHPSSAAAATLIALTPLLALAIAAGSGRRETTPPTQTWADVGDHRQP